MFLTASTSAGARKKDTMPICTIDGNVSAGKTTVLKLLHSRYGWPVDIEPVHKWAPYLQRFYSNQGAESSQAHSNAFEFQVRVWLDRCWIQPKANTSAIMLMERSPYFQWKVFVAAIQLCGSVSASEATILNEMYERAMTMWQPMLYIYLRSAPTHCYDRACLRSRQCEKGLTAEYLTMLHNLHEGAYVDAVRSGMRVLVIDVHDKTPDMIADEVHQILINWAM